MRIIAIAALAASILPAAEVVHLRDEGADTTRSTAVNE